MVEGAQNVFLLSVKSVEFFFGCGFLLVEFDNSFLFFWKEDWDILLGLII